MLHFDDNQNNERMGTATGLRLVSARPITDNGFYVLFTEPGTKAIAELEIRQTESWLYSYVTCRDF